MISLSIRIAPKSEYDQLRRGIQRAFRTAVVNKFGSDVDGPIPSDGDIDESFNAKGAHVYQVVLNDEVVGGVIVDINICSQHNKLLLFYVDEEIQYKGVGFEVWKIVEAFHPLTKSWETVTPYFEKRNVGFYVNKCGFHIVEYFNKYHPDPNQKSTDGHHDVAEEMFRLVKVMGGGVYKWRIESA